nr:arylesterase [Altericroceibacterium xinjiangense]
MRSRFLSIIALGGLAACGSETPVPEPGGNTTAVAPTPAQPVSGPERRILAFGDSLFAGYGVAPEESYPAQLEAALRARGINAKVTNAGVSGDTTAAGLDRLDYVLSSQAHAPDLAIVELGGNDLLRSIAPSETRKNLEGILENLLERNIPVLLMGMRAPPNMGPQFQQDFDEIYPDLAEQYDAELVPFFLAPVYDQPDLIQPDRVHPTAQGLERIVEATADDVAEALPPPTP